MATPWLLQVTYAVEQKIVEKVSDTSSGLWMFFVMTIVFLLVLKFGRKNSPTHQIESTELPVERKIKNNGAVKSEEDNSRY